MRSKSFRHFRSSRRGLNEREGMDLFGFELNCAEVSNSPYLAPRTRWEDGFSIRVPYKTNKKSISNTTDKR